MEKGKLKKCVISRYDSNCIEPPYETIPIDEVEVYEPDLDDLGAEFAERLRYDCFKKGYVFKFYTMSREVNFDYEIVVF